MLEEINIFNAGAIIDVNSDRARRHAELYYEEIRHRKDDVEKIASNTQFTREQILRVKSYLFLENIFCKREKNRDSLTRALKLQNHGKG